jgi:hypothetical protein
VTGAGGQSGFFGGLDTLQRIEDPRRAAASRVQVVSLLDLAGMKMRVTSVSHGIDVATGLAAAKAIDRRFDSNTSVRALQFYGDGNLNRVPAAMQKDLIR